MTTEEKVFAVVGEKLRVPPDKLTRAALLGDDLGGDELDRLEIIQELEDEFGVRFDGPDADRCSTVGNLVDYINSKL